MMRALVGPLASVVGVCVVLAACGGGEDDRLSDEEYFEGVESLVNQADGEISLSSEGIDVWDLEEARPQLAERYDSAAERTGVLAGELADLNPPERLESLHTEFVDAIRDLFRTISTLANLTSELPDGPGEETFAAVTAAYDRVRELSSAIQAAAAERGIEIALVWSEPSSGQTIDITEGIRGRLAEMPPLPDGLVAMSEYIEFELADEAVRAVIGMPLLQRAEGAAGLAWYAYEDGEWERLAPVVRLENDGMVASGDFDAVPASLAVLREE